MTPEKIAEACEDVYQGLGWSANDSEALIEMVRQALASDRQKLKEKLLRVKTTDVEVLRQAIRDLT